MLSSAVYQQAGLAGLMRSSIMTPTTPIIASPK